MNPLKNAPVLHDAEKGETLSRWCSLSRGELALWVVFAWLIPLAWLAVRPYAAEAGPIRIERPPREQAASAQGSAATRPDLNGASLARLDLNRATAKELELLPGIGPQRAEKIIARRAEKGPFCSVGELGELPGFSRSLVERLAPMLSVGAPAGR